MFWAIETGPTRSRMRAWKTTSRGVSSRSQIHREGEAQSWLQTKARAELEAEIDDLKDENTELQDQLDTIADIVAPADEDEDDGDGGTDDEEEEDAD
jgi:hypothetical protein